MIYVAELLNAGQSGRGRFHSQIASERRKCYHQLRADERELAHCKRSVLRTPVVA